MSCERKALSQNEVMEDNIFDKVQEVDLKKTMEKSYIEYAMSVIASRGTKCDSTAVDWVARPAASRKAKGAADPTPSRTAPASTATTTPTCISRG